MLYQFSFFLCVKKDPSEKFFDENSFFLSENYYGEEEEQIVKTVFMEIKKKLGWTVFHFKNSLVKKKRKKIKKNKNKKW